MTTTLTAKQLQRAAKIQAKIEGLQAELGRLLGGASSTSPAKTTAPVKRKMSAAARAKISAAQKLRWAKTKAKK
jgi:hypothetical protein